MDDTKCPLCGEPMEPTPASIVVSCRACNKSWTPRHLAIAAGLRARLIAEAVRPWAEALRDLYDALPHPLAWPTAKMRAVDRARVLLNSESVKANEETSND